MTPRAGAKFRDVYGNLWTFVYRFGLPFVTNPKMGVGVWDNGNGLRLITP